MRSRDRFLMRAVAGQNMQGIKMALYFLKASPNAVNREGETILMGAASIGNLEIVKMLMQAPNVHPNLVDFAGKTALDWAIESGSSQVVEYLLQQSKKSYLECVHDCCDRKQWGIAENLMASSHFAGNIDQPDKKGRTLLLKFIRGHRTATALKMLENKALNINVEDSNGATPLTCALASHDKDVLDKLLENPNLDVASYNKNRETPLMVASLFGFEYGVRKLLEFPQVKVMSRNKTGDTALSIAVQNGDEKVVASLLNSPKENPQAKVTSFSLKNKKRAEDVYRCLFVKDEKGNSVFDWACNKPAILGLLRKTAEQNISAVVPNIKTRE